MIVQYCWWFCISLILAILSSGRFVPSLFIQLLYQYGLIVIYFILWVLTEYCHYYTVQIVPGMVSENSFSLAPVPVWRSGTMGCARFICSVPCSSSELAFSWEWHGNQYLGTECAACYWNVTAILRHSQWTELGNNCLCTNPYRYLYFFLCLKHEFILISQNLHTSVFVFISTYLFMYVYNPEIQGSFYSFPFSSS